MTFDSDHELRKIAKHCPDARLAIRILVDDSNSFRPLSCKFGAPKEIVYGLLKLAKELRLNLMGVSFHVGSRCQDETAFSKAIEEARKVIDLAESEEFGFKITLLDIGGGFPGTKWHSNKENLFELIAKQINFSLEKHFPLKENAHLQIISEPGTYYCASSCYLACQIISKRQEEIQIQMNGREEDKEHDEIAADQLKKNHLYVNEGTSGSFFHALLGYKFNTPIALISEDQVETRNVFKSTIWGQTCSSLDKLFIDIPLPDMQIGEWLLFRDLGDYSLVFATQFNGFIPSGMMYCAQQETRKKLTELKTWPLIKRRLDTGTIENVIKYKKVRKLEK
jgi:ornithine decarboxylase